MRASPTEAGSVSLPSVHLFSVLCVSGAKSRYCGMPFFSPPNFSLDISSKLKYNKYIFIHIINMRVVECMATMTGSVLCHPSAGCIGRKLLGQFGEAPHFLYHSRRTEHTCCYLAGRFINTSMASAIPLQRICLRRRMPFGRSRNFLDIKISERP